MTLTKRKRNLKNSAWWKYALTALLFSFLIACEEDNPFEDPSANRDNYLGTWQVTENTGINHPQFYSINITAGTQDDEIVIQGLYNEPQVRVAGVVSGNSLSLPSQQSQGVNFVGSGTANADFSQIQITFTADDGAGPDVVEAVLVP